MLFGRKCERCGHRRATKRRGNRRLCQACLTRERADAESIRASPIDGTAIRKFMITDIILDHCPSCRGIWMAGGEMEKVKQHAREEGDQFGAGFIAGLIIG